MELKTFPLKFTVEYLDRIEQAAGRGNKEKFIRAAIEEKLLLEEMDSLLMKEETNEREE